MKALPGSMGAKPSIRRSRMLQQIWALPVALLIVGVMYFQMSSGYSVRGRVQCAARCSVF